MRTIGNGRIRRKDEGVSYGSGNNIKQLCDWDLATDDDIATIEASGYFNDLASVLQVGEVIYGRIDLNGVPRAKNWIVATNSGTAVTIRAVDDDDEATGGGRAVVPTADGLTTGLILASDDTVISTSANSAHILTLPAIATVGLGKAVKIFNGSTACKLATPASSNTKINNADSDGTATTTIPASSYTLATKILADNWMVECFVAAGTRTIPTPA